jgi:GxxExxY protein
MSHLERNRINSLLLNLAIEVHKALGSGMPENVYRCCFCRELEAHSIQYQLNRSYTLFYKEMPLEDKIATDILIFPDIVVFIRTHADPMAESNVRALLKLTGLHTGIIINFNVNRLIEGFKKITNAS